MRNKFLILWILLLYVPMVYAQNMMYEDCSRIGVPFAKDPFVVSFNNNYFMYYSLPPSSDKKMNWGIGIAISKDLNNWQKIGEINALNECTVKDFGICAPCGIVRNDTLHLFYQTYGLGKNDAICHAYSIDGIHFTRNLSNPIFRPTGEWNCGRAIDAEIILFNQHYYLYFATRDKEFKRQLVGVAVTGLNSTFDRNEWIQKCSEPILEPVLNWEGDCIEAPSIIQYGKKLFMFYAGNYNNYPQQIGVAVSEDGTSWKRLSNTPFLSCGAGNEWNSSESGHPCIFKYSKRKYYLFYQGNNDKGRTWKLSNQKIKF